MNPSTRRQNHKTTTFAPPCLRRLTLVLISLVSVTSMTVGCTTETFSAPREFAQRNEGQNRFQNNDGQQRSQTHDGQKRSQTDLWSPSIPHIVEVVGPAVVGVLNDRREQTGAAGRGDSFYRVGTAMLFEKDSHYGYLITNQGLVYPSAHVEVVLQSGRHVGAKVAGTDNRTDVAVLTVPVKEVANVPVIPFADSNALQAGEPAVAIGIGMNGDFAQSVTSGIISSPSRRMPASTQSRRMPASRQSRNSQPRYETVIQTDAALNPGNSGGPLLNLQGEVVGMNVGKIQKPGFEGMGFAIPSNAVRRATEKILQGNRLGN